MGAPASYDRKVYGHILLVIRAVKSLLNQLIESCSKHIYGVLIFISMQVELAFPRFRTRRPVVIDYLHVRHLLYIVILYNHLKRILPLVLLININYIPVIIIVHRYGLP